MGPNRGSSSGQHGAGNLLMPLSNRSLSPASYQQPQSAMQGGGGDGKNMMIGSLNNGGGQLGARKPASLGRKILGSGGLLGENSQSQSMHGPRGTGQQQRSGIGNSHQGYNTLSPANYNPRERQSSHQPGGYHGHNFHPMPEGQASGKNNAGHSIVHGSSHYHSLNMRGDGAENRRRPNDLNNSMDGVNLLNSNDQLGGIARNQITTPANKNDRGGSPSPGPSAHPVHQGVSLNKKILGTRKRNQGREKSYEQYNQKL